MLSEDLRYFLIGSYRHWFEGYPNQLHSGNVLIPVVAKETVRNSLQICEGMVSILWYKTLEMSHINRGMAYNNTYSESEKENVNHLCLTSNIWRQNHFSCWIRYILSITSLMCKCNLEMYIIDRVEEYCNDDDKIWYVIIF